MIEELRILRTTHRYYVRPPNHVGRSRVAEDEVVETLQYLGDHPNDQWEDVLVVEELIEHREDD